MTVVEQTAQQWEADWWGDCANTFGEEAKQLSYAHRMGLVNEPFKGKWPVYDLAGRSVLDLGGGPTSMLLKTRNGRDLTVVDPCVYPDWVAARYEQAGIDYAVEPAETYNDGFGYDEVWIYNVLQHVVDPEACIATARAHAPLLRIFEWLDTSVCDGHPHTLTAAELNRWIGGTGTVEQINENGCVGSCYYGAFSL